LHGDEYFEYLVGDYGYLSEEMFIMRKIRRHDVGPNDQDVIKAYNKMHRVWVKWGIGGLGDWWISGLKRKWRWLLKRFNFTKPKYTILFRTEVILTNFLHRC